MSASVMPTATFPVCASPAPSNTQSESTTDDQFSRILADQHSPVSAATQTPCHSEPGNAPDATSDEDNNARPSLEHAADSPPDAALAALTLDIAMQTAAQLRGAALRTRDSQADDIETFAPHVAQSRPEKWLTDPFDPVTAETAGVPLAALGRLPTRLASDARHAFLLPSSLAAHAAASESADHRGDPLRTFLPPPPFEFAAPEHPKLQPELSFDVTALHADALPFLASEQASLLSASQTNIAESVSALSPRDDTLAPLHVAAPLGTAQWGSTLGRQLVISLSRHSDGNSHTAELRLDPPELGPLRVTLTLNDGVAHAAFASPHASVRHAIEAAMSQLHDTLSQAGISLGQTNVSDQHAADQPSFEQAFDHANGRTDQAATSAADSSDAAAPRRTPRGDTLIDTFA